MTAKHHPRPEKLPRTAGAGSSGGGEVLRRKREHYSKAQQAQYEWLKKHHPFSSNPPRTAGAGSSGGGEALKKHEHKKRSAAGLHAGTGWVTAGNDDLPDCAAVAVANTLLAAAGIRAADGDVLRLHDLAGCTCVRCVLETLAACGLGGHFPAGFWPCGPGRDGKPVIAGLTDGESDHAAARTTAGLICWGAPLGGALLDTWTPDGEYWAVSW